MSGCYCKNAGTQGSRNLVAGEPRGFPSPYCPGPPYSQDFSCLLTDDTIRG
jgi:hypothetical protein